MVALDQGQREVDARGHTGGREDRPVLHEDGIGLHPHPRERGSEQSGVLPVRRRTPAVQQAGAGQHEGAGADRGRTSGPAGQSRRGGGEFSTDRVRRERIAADHEGRPDVGRRSDVAVHGDAHTRRGAHRGAVAGAHLQLVPCAEPGGLREYLERPGQVE